MEGALEGRVALSRHRLGTGDAPVGCRTDPAQAAAPAAETATAGAGHWSPEEASMGGVPFQDAK